VLRLLTAAVVALLLAGCGGDADRDASEPDYSTEAVIAHFKEETGDVLSKQISAPGQLDVLDGDDRAAMIRRYGLFTIYVFTRDPRKGVDGILKSNVGQTVKPPDAEGIYWARMCPPPEVSVHCFFAANKPFGNNVVLGWIAGKGPVKDARFDRVARVLAGLP
jgi:hypothetical protein